MTTYLLKDPEDKDYGFCDEQCLYEFLAKNYEDAGRPLEGVTVTEIYDTCIPDVTGALETYTAPATLWMSGYREHLLSEISKLR